MSYYLKKTNLKKGLYLQIYEGHHDKTKGYTRSSVYRTIGYFDALVASGIEDPIGHFQKEVDALNVNLRLERERRKHAPPLIGDITPLKCIGYFPIKNILDDLGVKSYINLFQAVRGFKFSLYEVMSALVFSRMIDPCSKLATHNDVMPALVKDYRCSYDQILQACEFLGSEYEKVVELFTVQVQKQYGVNTDTTYFDCTNFYFEIDKEDGFRRKGPSKEKKSDPIVGLGLLLDADMIPIGMNLFPGNQSEKPVLRTIVALLKAKNNIQGRTIHVADKGLNCSENIMQATRECDGYLFSKSIKMLPETEKLWVLLDHDWTEVNDDNGSLQYTYKQCVDSFPYSYINDEGRRKKIYLREKRVVTYSPQLARKQRREINRMVEKAKKLCHSQAKKAEFGETGKYITFVAKGNTGEKIIPAVNQQVIDDDLALCGYNLLVTSETHMGPRDLYEVYHNLWRIEESFRVMKSYLDARPVFLQKEDSIKGHFLICYISVLLTRILQFKRLGNRYGTPELMKFIRTFKVVKTGEREYLNVTLRSSTIDNLSREFDIPLNNLFISHAAIQKMRLLD